MSEQNNRPEKRKKVPVFQSMIINEVESRNPDSKTAQLTDEAVKEGRDWVTHNQL